MNKIPSSLLNDRYWRSVIHLFKNHYKLQQVFTTKYFDLSEGTIKIGLLRKVSGPWSESEKFMLKLALHLFNERNKVNLGDMDYLDDSIKKLAIEAIKLRYM
ncbi:hypothetical protein [Sutcliffiella sp. NC1]|uniref:hypothetical protein n=1 Tax=Sutcliffiella sp. NC1 TaxID=3004096 RepID=UPI0022DD6395|nr:hypothetical protein [Sutcliffiella sp. NC1]WBL16407.1 hypothetical protein O1A01_07175 [Sutcliffiella sp. NC1]